MVGICAQQERDEHYTESGLMAQSSSEHRGLKGQRSRFQVSELAWRALHRDVSRDLVGKFVVFASLRNNMTNGTTVNIEDGRGDHMGEGLAGDLQVVWAEGG